MPVKLMAYDCETAAGFCYDIGMQDEGFFNALVLMFEEVVQVTLRLPSKDRDAMIGRLDRVRTISHNFGYGVGDDMDTLLANYAKQMAAVNSPCDDQGWKP